MNKFIRDLLSDGRHQIALLLEKSEVPMIGASRESVDLDRIRAPVFEKRPKDLHRKLALGELVHERSPIDL